MRSLISLAAVLIALGGCHAKTGAPGEAPTGVTAKAGDGLVVLNWDVVPDLTYWIFLAAGDTVSVGQPGSFAIRRAIAPRVVNGLTNDTKYAFAMNATHNDSSAGPLSLPVPATPRLAGTQWPPGTLVATQNLRNIGFNGSLLVVVGDAATVFAQDFNYVQGATTLVPPATFPSGYTSDLVAATFSTGWLVLARDGTTISSPDGVNWYQNLSIGQFGPIPAGGMNGITFGFVGNVVPTYVAVGAAGTVYVSHDLLSWAAATSVGTTNDLYNVALVNGFFIAVGAGGTVIISQDGNNWQAPLNGTGTTAALRSIAFGPSASSPTLVAYVAVGDGGTIIASPDTNTWTAATWNTAVTPVAQDLRSVTVGGAAGTRFLAVGQGGAVAYSDDGFAPNSWNVPSSGTTSNLAKVLYIGGVYFGVGDGGAELESR